MRFLPTRRYFSLLICAVLIASAFYCRKRGNAELGMSLIQAVRDGSAGEVRDLIKSGRVFKRPRRER